MSDPLIALHDAEEAPSPVSLLADLARTLAVPAHELTETDPPRESVCAPHTRMRQILKRFERLPEALQPGIPSSSMLRHLGLASIETRPRVTR